MIRYSVCALLGALTACGGIVADQRAEPDAGPPTTPSVDGGVDTDASSDAGRPLDGAADAAPLPPAGVSDGVCDPGDVTLGFYDPDCVYIIGSTDPGNTYKDALFHPIDPTRLAVGWGSNSSSHTLRADRKLLFTSYSFAGAYVFGPGLPTDGMQQQLAHHTLVSTPACGGASPWLRSLHLHPKSGSGGPPGYYLCISGGNHYYEIGTSTELDIGGRYLMAIDENGAMLARPVGGELVILDGTDVRPVIGIEASKVTRTRSKRGGGFLVAAVAGSDVHFPRLYDLDIATGVATERGQYHMGSLQLSSVTALEPSGALIAMVTLTPPFDQGIVRLTIDAPPEIVFDETKYTSVQLHITRLVTGP